MLGNLRLHTELLSSIPVFLLIAGGILGYGGGFILKLLNKKPSDNMILAVKFVGLILVLAGITIVFMN